LYSDDIINEIKIASTSSSYIPHEFRIMLIAKSKCIYNEEIITSIQGFIDGRNGVLAHAI